MIRLISSLLLAFGLLAYMPISSASAGGFHHAHARHGMGGGGKSHGHHGGHGFKPSSDVPELDPTAAAGALTLLAGGALMLGGRRRRVAL